MSTYLIGVDGGGTGTRVAIANRDGTTLGEGAAGPSALGQGVEAAWQQILQAVSHAFSDASLAVPPWSKCAMGAGLSGVGHRPSRQAFSAQNPGFLHLTLASDAYTMLLGAHGGAPGLMVAAGTGSIAEVLRRDGTRQETGGWGFPVGDEGSGAWLGLHAMAHAQAALDGRAQEGELARKVWAQCGGTREEILAWCASARQFQYGQLAPCVFEAAATDPAADTLLTRAAEALERLAEALDPDGTLPLALCGSVGRQLQSRLRMTLRERLIEPRVDAVQGAIILIKEFLKDVP